MKRILNSIAILTLAFGVPMVAAQEPPPETKPAPLTMATGEKPFQLAFQIGADGFGGLVIGGIDFIGGLNATLIYPIGDLFYAGIRPALHYVYQEDTDYEATWFHPDVIFQLNILHDPVRLYVFAAGGFAVAIDGDLYPGIAHGFSAAGGVGVSWRAKGPWGLFAELGFRYGSASLEQSMLVLDANGKPQCVEYVDNGCLEYVREDVTRDFELTALTVNIGVVYEP
jgi:hypothetical protein